MKNSIYPILAIAALAAGCSSQGPDDIGPGSGGRNQIVLAGTTHNGGGLTLYRETTETIAPDDYERANGSSLGLPVDAIYEPSADTTLFLHHREAGRITVLSAVTRKKLAEIDGFPGGADSGLTGMAFSNLSQGWVIAHGSRNLYHIDAVNWKRVAAIPLPGNPTTVAASERKVVVGMRLPDGRGGIAIFTSNTPGHPIEKTLEFPEPIIFASAMPGNTQMVLLSSGRPGPDPSIAEDDVKPIAYLLDMATLEIVSQYEVYPSPSLEGHIGKQPTYAAVSSRSYLYVATPYDILRIDPIGLTAESWLPGAFSAIAVDYWSDLLYGYLPAESSLKRRTIEGEELSPVPLPEPALSLEFVSSSKIALQ